MNKVVSSFAQVLGSKGEYEERGCDWPGLSTYLSTCGDTAAAFLLMVPCWLAEAGAVV